jgi:pimeloyl-ACP methyl ester carboxylesterase
LDAGLGDSSLVWAGVQRQLTDKTRVCSYDRAGIGWSDPGPRPRTYQQAARELQAMLAKAGKEGPYVLVGHSAGANTVRLFASTFPEEVAGLVLIEPPILPEVKPVFVAVLKTLRTGVGVLARLGVVRFLGRISRMRLLFGGVNPPAELSKQAGFLYRPESILASIHEVEGLPETFRAMDQITRPGAWRDWPVVIIAAYRGKTPTEEVNQPFQQLADLSTNGKVIRVRSSHFIHFERPEVVVQAIEEIIQDIRQGE